MFNIAEAKIKDAYKVPRALSLYSPTIKNSQILDKFESDIALRFKNLYTLLECVQIVASSSPTTQSDFPMKAPWNASDSFLEINEMPFYWRLSDTPTNNSEISARLPIRITQDHKYDYLKFEPTPSQWSEIDNAYKQDANIGFLNPESGQMLTYGSSVNNFFLTELERCSPQNIIEIGCGAGYSIQFLRDHGFDVLGVDPSEYSLRWSEKIGFRLINKFFDENIFNSQPDFIYCNDVLSIFLQSINLPPRFLVVLIMGRLCICNNKLD